MTLRFYTRDGCCLCESAEEALRRAGVAFERLGIKGDAGLIARYGHRVPVLVEATAAVETVLHEGPLGVGELRALQLLRLRRAKAAKRAILKP